LPTLIGTDDPDRWRAALDGLAHGYWHRWEPNRALALGHGRPVLYSDHDADSGARAACVFAERDGGGALDVYTPAGFSGFVAHGEPRSLRARWLEFAAERGYACGYFALHPRVAVPGMHAGLATTRTLHLLDLADGAAAALGRFDRDVHRVLRHWQADRVQLVEDRARLRDFIVAQHAPFMASVGASPAAVWSDATLQAMCEDPGLLMVGAADAEGVCSVYTFGVGATGADAHLSLSLRDGRKAIPALVAWGIEALAARGAQWLNLGGGVADDDAIARAKRKFGPVEAPLQVAREVYDADAFARLCARAGVDASTEGYFPPYHRPAPARGGDA
jgi:hypothetical protein